MYDTCIHGRLYVTLHQVPTSHVAPLSCGTCLGLFPCVPAHGRGCTTARLLRSSLRYADRPVPARANSFIRAAGILLKRRLLVVLVENLAELAGEEEEEAEVEAA